jgi:predicted DNA-binding transcriptional regulator AlpA
MRYLTQKEAAERLGVTQSTISRRIRAGLIAFDEERYFWGKPCIHGKALNAQAKAERKAKELRIRKAGRIIGKACARGDQFITIAQAIKVTGLCRTALYDRKVVKNGLVSVDDVASLAAG